MPDHNFTKYILRTFKNTKTCSKIMHLLKILDSLDILNIHMQVVQVICVNFDIVSHRTLTLKT